MEGLKVTVKELKDKIGIKLVVSLYVNLTPAGKKRYRGLCPFHEDKDPSLYVYTDTQSFHCYGCGFGGDIFDFLMRIQNKSFNDVVKLLKDYLRQKKIK